MTTLTCTRASTLAKACDTVSDGLLDYATATAIATLVLHEDLWHRALLVDRDGGWRGYKGVVTEAKARRGKVEASGGTNIHSALEALAKGADTSRVPDSVLAPARLVLKELEALGVTIERSEQFTAAIGVFPEDIAGTADLILRHAGHLYVGDLKTVEEVGRNTKFSALAWCVQETCYAFGRPALPGYEPARDGYGRPRVDTEQLTEWPAPMDTSTALIIEVARDGSGIASHEIALDPDLVRLACQVRAERKKRRI